MPSFNGQPVTQRGGAGAGRGDDAHGVTQSQWQTDQHSLAHADGFIGPRVGEAYGDGRWNISKDTTAPTMQGGTQQSPASGFVEHNNNGNAGTADRMAHLDNVAPGPNVRMHQHRATGNIVETWDSHDGSQRVNEWGTSAGGRSMRPHNDTNMNPGGNWGKGIDVNNGEYTDVTDQVRGTQTYKEGKQ